MIFFPSAKINIGLRITARRTDGYHDIETLFYLVRLSDAVEFVPADNSFNKDELKVTGIDTGCLPENNLVIKTVEKLRERVSFPFLKIHLHKVIPVGAGLGGGSSDAACLLKTINRHFALNISNDDLRTVALELGSDCPFFIDPVPSLASGRGEKLIPAGDLLTGYYIVLINPGITLSTHDAYRNCLPHAPATSLASLIEMPLSSWKDSIINDFEGFAFKQHPEIGEIKSALYRSGALFSLMSGSGSCVYGIFLVKPDLPQNLKSIVIWEGLM